MFTETLLFISLHIKSQMEKLRTTYLKYQSEIQAPDPRFVSAEKTKKLIKMADL